MGVWIETIVWQKNTPRKYSHTLRGCVDWNLKTSKSSSLNRQSHPSWVCGLKQKWEEYCAPACNVTPFVGVWIETAFRIDALRQNQSHPSWVCGLKHVKCKLWNYKLESHPSWVCGLKPADMIDEICRARHTLRGCVDWNIVFRNLSGDLKKSHPSWVCGLKRRNRKGWRRSQPVTPFVGVWIETYSALWWRVTN